MGLSLTNWQVQLFDARTGLEINDDSGVCNVLTASSPVEITIYSDENGTSASNPIAFTDGLVSFWTANTVTSLDLSIMTAEGYAVFVEGLTVSDHRVVINKENRNQVLVVPFAASDNAETDTGFDFPANCLIDTCMLKVVTVDATETVDCGLLSSESGGDANGFITLASVATAGYPELRPQITGGTNIDYVGTNYVGALLATSIAGADAVATVGGWTPVRHKTDGTAKSITYTGSAGSDTAAGYFVFLYTNLI